MTTHLFDQDFPPEERLPLRMDAVLWETQPGTARMTVNAILTGDPLTDNSYVQDGYRFHDVMHLRALVDTPALADCVGCFTNNVVNVR